MCDAACGARLSKMPINRLYLLLFISISYYLARFYLCGSDLDIYSTNVYYFNWLESLGSVQLSGRLFFDVVQATAGEIRSFEPVAGFIFLGLVNVFEKPSDVIVLSNMIFLVVYFFTLSNSNQGALFSLLGVVAVIFGYYEFAVMELTHRLKVSVLFLFLFSYFYAHNRRRLAIVNLGLSVFSHFSMVIVLPYIYLLSRQGLIRPIARTSYLSFFVLILVMFGGLSTVLSDSVISQVFANKVHYFAIFFDVIGYKSILLGGGLFGRYLDCLGVVVQIIWFPSFLLLFLLLQL